MKILWDTRVKDRNVFKEVFLYMENEPTRDASKQLLMIKDSLKGLQLGMGYFYKAFVKDTHYFLSLQRDDPYLIFVDKLKLKLWK